MFEALVKFYVFVVLCIAMSITLLWIDNIIIHGAVIFPCCIRIGRKTKVWIRLVGIS